MSNLYYIGTDGVLRKLWQDNEEVFNTIVLPKILINPVLQLAHDPAGHKGLDGLSVYQMIVLLEQYEERYSSSL